MSDNMDILKEIKATVNENKERLQSLQTTSELTRKDIERLNANNEKLHQKQENLEKKVDTLAQQMGRIQALQKHRNILIFNIPDNPEINKNLYPTLADIFGKVNLNLPDTAIDAAFRLGKIPGNRPVLIRLIASRWKALIFTKAREIQDLGYGMANDLTIEEREQRRKLLALRTSLIKSFAVSQVFFLLQIIVCLLYL